METFNENQNEEPILRSVTWDQLGDRAFNITEGDTIDLAGTDEIDRFEELMVERVCYSFRRHESMPLYVQSRQMGYYRPNSPQYLPLHFNLKPKNFRGDIKDVTAIIKSNDPDYFGGRYSDEAITVSLVGSMFSTGKGCIGATQREVMYFPRLYDSDNPDPVGRKFTRHNNFQAGQKKVAEVHLQSSTIAFQVASKGLRRVISAGLPTLGKKR